MSEPPDKNAVLIAGLLNKLADLSGEAASLEAYRREAESFDPSLSTAVIALDLLAIETEPAARREVLGYLKHLQQLFESRGELAAAARIIAGLETIEGARGPS